MKYFWTENDMIIDVERATCPTNYSPESAPVFDEPNVSKTEDGFYVSSPVSRGTMEVGPFPTLDEAYDGFFKVWETVTVDCTSFTEDPENGFQDDDFPF